MPRTKSAGECAAAAAIIVLATAVSPIGIEFATGRLDLSPRINVLSLTFDVFLLLIAVAIFRIGARTARVLTPSCLVFPASAHRGD